MTEVHDLADAFERARHALRIFGTYVPRQLVDRLMRNPRQAQLTGERRRLGLMFTDIVGYSAIAERLPPEDLMTRTSAYFERIGQVIAAHNGIIDKFIGDAVMAMWNAPDLDPDYARDCCRAALALAATVREFNAAAARDGAPAFRTRIGIHAGDCVVGNVGSSDRVSYTAMGAEVNLASRVEGLNTLYGTTILATRALADEARGPFPVPLDRPRRAGRHERGHRRLRAAGRAAGRRHAARCAHVRSWCISGTAPPRSIATAALPGPRRPIAPCSAAFPDDAPGPRHGRARGPLRRRRPARRLDRHVPGDIEEGVSAPPVDGPAPARAIDPAALEGWPSG